MHRVRLERAEKAITEFRDKNKECYGELIFLLHKYRNYYFHKKRFSLNYRCLFRIITDRLREEDINNKLYNPMKEDVERIRSKYEDTFDDFSTLVKRHVDMESSGYNVLARLMYGESIEYILQETDTEETKRQELRLDVITKFLNIYNDKEDEHFSNGITKNIFITNLITQSKTYDYNTLCQLTVTSYELSKASFIINSVADNREAIYNAPHCQDSFLAFLS